MLGREQAERVVQEVEEWYREHADKVEESLGDGYRDLVDILKARVLKLVKPVETWAESGDPTEGPGEAGSEPANESDILQ